MKKIVLIIILLALGGAVYYFLSVSNTECGTCETKTDAQGGIEIAVTPIFTDGGLTFNIGINTHTVALTGDMLQMAELKDAAGNIYKPISWSGGELNGGHHAEGILKFDVVVKLIPKKTTLVIKNLGGVPERKFVW